MSRWILITLISLSIRADDIDNEIIKNLDFFIKMDILESDIKLEDLKREDLIKSKDSKNGKQVVAK